MQVVVPVPVTLAALLSSSVAGSTNPAWAIGTAYAKGDRVVRDAPFGGYLVSGVRVTMPIVFEAVAAHSGKDPADPANVVGKRVGSGPKNTTGPWAMVGAEERWRPFDGRVGAMVSEPDNVVYRIAVTQTITAVVLFRVSAADVRLEVEDASGGTLYLEVQDAVDDDHMTDAWLYLTGAPFVRQTLAFTGFAAPAGSVIVISLRGSGTRQVGEIVLGRSYRLGTLLTDPEVGYDDYSRIERDDFGNVDVIRRNFADRASYRVHLDARDAGHVLNLLADLRGLPAVFHGGDELTAQGLTVLGMVEAPPFQIAGERTAFLNLDVKGLT